MAAELTKITDNPKPIRRIDEGVVMRSRLRPGLQENPFAVPSFPPAIMAAMKRDKIPTMAMDDMIASTLGWAATDQIVGAYNEGLVFLGYSYLSVLSQRPEFRVVTEVISTEMTREWIEIKVASGDESKNDKVKFIEDEMDRLSIRDGFRKVTESDGFFGRGHLYLDTGMTDDSEELKMDIGNGRNQLSKLKIGPKKNQKLIAVRPVEATWAYPTNYESIDPLKRDWYKPRTWYVMSREIHRSRLLTFVGREVPDILKPAYAFGGLSMSQMLKPYVDNWLRTRQSVSDLIQNFSVNVLRTNMDATTGVGGDALFSRVQLFNNVKNNQGTMVIDKDSEDWSNVSVPLGGLDSLQAQSQEHMAAISRIPLVKLLGIQPAGLNASSEGELVAFEDWIAAFQELLYRAHLTTIIDLIQLTVWGKIDQDIIFEFKPLRQQKPDELASIQQTKATTREAYLQMGAVGADEVRETLAEDPDSPFEGLDLSKPLPQPPMPGPGELGGAPGAGGPPGGGAPPPPPPPGPPEAGGPPPGGEAPDAALFYDANGYDELDFLPGLIEALNAACDEEEAFDAWTERLHPRGQKSNAGQFVAGAAQKGAEAVKGAAGAVGEAVKGGAHAAAQGVQNAAKTAASYGTQRSAKFLDDFTKDDFKTLQTSIEPHSEVRRNLAQRIGHVAMLPVRLLAGHLKHEGHKWKAAIAGFKELLAGRRPTKEHFRAMRLCALSSSITAASFLAGDVTGGGAVHAAVALGHEVVHHAIYEHTIKLLASGGRYALSKVPGLQGALNAGTGGTAEAHGHDASPNGAAPPDADFSDEDLSQVQDFMKTLAKVWESHAPSPEVKQGILDKAKSWITDGDNDNAADVAQDAWKEEDHPRGHPSHAGQFIATKSKSIEPAPKKAKAAEDEDVHAAMRTLNELAGRPLTSVGDEEISASDKEFDPQEHPHRGKGEGGGQFVSKGEGGGTTTAEPEPEPEAPPKVTRPEGATPRPTLPLQPKIARPAGAKPRPEPKPPRPKKVVYGASEVFISPNTGELTFPGAEHELHGKRHEAYRTVSAAVDSRLGLRTDKGVDVIGAWTDGAEDTVMTTYAKSADRRLIRVAAAIKASVANQKSALIFTPHDDGPHTMVNFELKGDVSEIHESLLSQGLNDHTLEPTEDGARVHILATTQEAVDAIDRVAALKGVDVEHDPGDGDFIGTNKYDGTDEEQRADAQRVYAEIIHEAADTFALEEGVHDVWADARNHWASETEGAPLAGSQGHPGLISTRRPSAAGSLEGDRYRQINLEAEKQSEALFKAHTDVFRNARDYPNLRPAETEGKTPQEVADAFKAHIKSNLLFLYREAPQEMRERAHLWYEGAHNLAAKAAKRYNLPVTSTAGVYAALSPQKLWDMNVYLGDAVIDIHQTKQNHKWDDDMGKTAARIWTPKKAPTSPIAIKNAAAKARIVGLMRGKTLAELNNLPDPDDRMVAKAMWIRTYDEAHSDRHFNRLAPDGDSMGVYRKKKTPKQVREGKQGDPAKAAWQSTPAIINALRALESDGKRNIISEAMGAQHKVRSFYNNILDPHSDNEDVTMDTHAVGAALMRALSGNDVPVMHSLATNPKDAATSAALGYKKPKEDSALGVNGTYAIYADAYRELAHELSIELKRKIEPRELQSVTWEAKRAMFDNTTTDRQYRLAAQAWRNYHNGRADLRTTQRRVLRIAGGFKRLEDIQDTHD